jgi:amino acid transporter
LARKSIGLGSLLVFAAGASSPMAVMTGGVVATYATTGVVGVPLSFLILGVAIGLLSVGYVAMARHVPHAATAYALLAHGLGRTVGVVGAAVALLSYNAIQCSLYGLVGATLAGLLGGAWWAWAAVTWVVVGWLGVRHVQVSALVLAVTLVGEVAVIGLLDLAAFTHPAGGHISLTPLVPGHLFVNGVGGVFALGVAAFVGYECGPVFAEEARGERTVARATLSALGFLAVFYAISSWAMAAGVGIDAVVDASRDPASGVPFSILTAVYGGGWRWVATALFVTSVVAAMLSFHNTVARYLFALGRERVLPEGLARIGSGGRAGAPIGGSLVQSGIGALVLTAAVMLRADPIAVVFTWLSAVAAVGVLVLLLGCSVAALRFFHVGGGTTETWWVRVAAPALGVAAGTTVLATTVANVASLLGVAPGSPLTYAIPGAVGLAALLGVWWAWGLRRRHPNVFAGVGLGRPHPLAVPDQRLAGLEV